MSEHRDTPRMIADLHASASWIVLPYPEDAARIHEAADRMLLMHNALNAVVAAVDERDLAYANREHGGIANHTCADTVAAAMRAYVAATADNPV